MQIYNYKLRELLTHNAGLVIFYEKNKENKMKIEKTFFGNQKRQGGPINE
jgi:hypothetical protein